jgi:hypothetical protein
VFAGPQEGKLGGQDVVSIFLYAAHKKLHLKAANGSLSDLFSSRNVETL